MHAAQASEWGGPRHHHHHRHHRGPRGCRGLDRVHDGRPRRPVGRSAPVQGDVLGPGPGGPRPHRAGGRRGGRRGGRARRGDVRAAMLLLLEEQPQNGYQLIQEIERRTEGVWKPSPGSVYPALQQLEDEGLVQATELEGKRAYELTAEGREYVESNREELGNPFEAATGGMDEGVIGPARPDVPGRRRGHAGRRRRPHRRGSQDPRRHPPRALQDPRRGRPRRAAATPPDAATPRRPPSSPGRAGGRVRLLRGQTPHIANALVGRSDVERSDPSNVGARCWSTKKSGRLSRRAVLSLRSRARSSPTGCRGPTTCAWRGRSRAWCASAGRCRRRSRSRRRGAGRARRRRARGAGQHRRGGQVRRARPRAGAGARRGRRDDRRRDLAPGGAGRHPRVRHRRARRRAPRRARHVRRVRGPGDARARRDLRRVRGREVDPRHPRDARAARDAERDRARLPDRHVPRLLPDVVRAAAHVAGGLAARRSPRCCAPARGAARPARSSWPTRSTSRWTPSCTTGCCARGWGGGRQGISGPRRDAVPARALPHAARSGESLRANVRLVLRNAALAAEIAAA